MEIWQYILSIILFLIALGVLVTIHELGHFIAAKSFNVYCQTFSIGFGPKICKVKRINGETTFTIGILPLGGYVSMFGEGVDVPDGKDVGRKRGLNGIARWKRFIIMGAGIAMNFVLAYIIFFISASCFPQYELNYANSLAIYNNEEYQTSLKLTNLDGTAFDLKSEDFIEVNTYYIQNNDAYYGVSILSNIEINDEGKKVYLDNSVEINGTRYVLGFSSNTSGLGLYQFEEFSNLLTLYEAQTYEDGVIKLLQSSENGESTFVDYSNPNLYLPKYDISESGAFSYRTHTISSVRDDANNILDDDFQFRVVISRIEDEESSTTSRNSAYLNITDSDHNGVIDDLNFGVYYRTYWYGWDSFKVAGEDWVQSTTLISQALGQLFVGQGWENMGGPVAIFTQTTAILQNNPFNYYLQTWGIISVNLALFNLLPFPGLDGWHLVVTLIEGITNTIRRKIYNKKLTKEGKEISKDVLRNYEDLTLDIKFVEDVYELNFEKKLTEEKASFEITGSDSSNDSTLDPKVKMFDEYEKKVEILEDFKDKENLSDVEVFKEWEIPEKVKNIISYVGLILLFALIIGIFIKDIIGLF